MLIFCAIAFNASAQDLFPPPPPHDGEPSFQDANRPPRSDHDRQRGPQQYNLEQAISDNTQLKTIAFSGLAFLTGSFGCDTFLPPGKVSDYFGFQYMRDVQPDGKGHNTDFLTRIANNMIYILTDAQRQQLIDLGTSQESQVQSLAYKRFPLIKAFCRQAEGEIPAGRSGLNKDAVMKYASDIFKIDGELAYQRAVVCGKILRELNDEQKAYLSKLKFNDYTTWPTMDEPLDKRSMTHAVNVLVMTYASEMFSWYAGSAEADTYFCPERHGTYFGGFFMKDAPAMGQRNYSISTSITGDSGEEFLNILDDAQREQITGIIKLQHDDLEEIVKTRSAISAELRKLLVQNTADKAKIIALSKRYGELDGSTSWLYAMRFAEINKSLTEKQKTALIKLRNMDIQPNGAFVYSEPIAVPDMQNTDFLFTPVKGR
jgi:Spy/CpxP family protein refolding chaperone